MARGDYHAWWDQLLAPFGGTGGCCDSRDDHVERGSFPGATANNKRPHPLAFVPESTPERNNALDYRSRMRYSRQPHPLQTRVMSSTAHMNSVLSPGTWQVSVDFVSACNLPKRDVLELSEVVGCVSVFDVDDTVAACAGNCLHALNHQVQPGSGGQFSGIAICAKNPSFTNGAYYVMPQFQTKRCESNLPKNLFNPQFSESFTTFEPHPSIHFQNGDWRVRTSAGIRTQLSGRDTVLLVSVHDVKVEGPANILGFTIVPIRAGDRGLWHKNDAWHPLFAGSAYVYKGRQDGDDVAESGHERPELTQKEWVSLRGHLGALSSINLRTAYTFERERERQEVAIRNDASFLTYD